jgi:FKBP12-rapamycin complex-associated protein
LLRLLLLQHVAPALLAAEDLELAVPGTYVAGQPVVRIKSFHRVVDVMASKQKPRKAKIYGSDGHRYVFLLKGKEDLRQDERVMQVFGLVNALLSSDNDTKSLQLTRYAVLPLSHNVGLVEWVPDCDTLHMLIKEYRDARGIGLQIEHRLMSLFAPDLPNLTAIQKLEVFQHALEQTQGMDLAKVSSRPCRVCQLQT